MKKFFIILIFFAVVLLLFMLFRQSQDSYKLLPGADEEQVMPPAYASWTKFSSPSDLFTADFPTTPQYTTDVTRNEVGVIERTNELYVSEQEDGTVFLVSVVRYHSHGDSLPLSPEQMMSNVMYEMTDQKEGSELVGFKKNQVLGHKGLQFTIVNKAIQMEVQTFTRKNDLYIMTYIASLEVYNDRDFDYFLNSFKLTSE